MTRQDDAADERIHARICWQAMRLREAARDAHAKAGAVAERLSAFDPDELGGIDVRQMQFAARALSVADGFVDAVLRLPDVLWSGLHA